MLIPGGFDATSEGFDELSVRQRFQWVESLQTTEVGGAIVLASRRPA